jgi:hypothetical protein
MSTPSLPNGQDGGRPMTKQEVREMNDILWAEHSHDVSLRFAGQWVAIRDRAILAHGANRDQVLSEAMAATGLPADEFVMWPIAPDAADWTWRPTTDQAS